VAQYAIFWALAGPAGPHRDTTPEPPPLFDKRIRKPLIQWA